MTVESNSRCNTFNMKHFFIHFLKNELIWNKKHQYTIVSFKFFTYFFTVALCFGKKKVSKLFQKLGFVLLLLLLREVENAFKTNDDFHVYTFLGCFVKYKCDYTILYNKNPEHTTSLLCCCFIGF